VKRTAFQPPFLFTHPPLPFSLLPSHLPWFCTGFATCVVVYPISYRSSNYWVITQVAMVEIPTCPLRLALDTMHEAGSVPNSAQGTVAQTGKHACSTFTTFLFSHILSVIPRSCTVVPLHMSHTIMTNIQNLEYLSEFQINLHALGLYLKG
jgi:hypothetical protein